MCKKKKRLIWLPNSNPKYRPDMEGKRDADKGAEKATDEGSKVKADHEMREMSKKERGPEKVAAKRCMEDCQTEISV